MLTIYQASAGSGKTYMLAKQYITLLLTANMPRSHRRILAVTFTHKATNEMKIRILKELNALALNLPHSYRTELAQKRQCSEAKINEQAQNVLIDILQDYSAFSVSTIDSFFQQVVRAFARETGLSGSYGVELDTNDLLKQAVDNLFFELDKTENKELLQWMTEFAIQNIEENKSWDPHTEIESLGKEIFKEAYQSKLSKKEKIFNDKSALKNYKKSLTELVHNFENQVQNLAKRGLGLIKQAQLTIEDFKGKSKSPIKTLEKIENEDLSKLSLSVQFKSLADGNADDYYSAQTSPEKKAKIQSLVYESEFPQIIQEIIRLFDTSNKTYCSAKIILQNMNTLGIISDIVKQIDTICAEQNIVPISNTNILLNNIIAGNDAPFIYEKTGVNVQHFMIDEFQDTSTMQWSNFRPLITNSVASGNENMIVGDVKQSIYRWRNSDWNLLDNEVPNDTTLHPLLEPLETNWRSSRKIVEFNNHFFAAAIQHAGKLLPSPYKEKIEHVYSNLTQKTHKQEEAGYVEIGFMQDDSFSDENSWKQMAMERMLGQIRKLEERKIPLHKIAILTRQKKDAKQITTFLLEKNYNVVSNEGLLIGSASGVRFLLGILKLWQNSADEVLLLNVNYEYACECLNLSSAEALARATATKKFLFTHQEQEQLETTQSMPLYDMVTQIVSIFHLSEWKNNDLFVQAFMDEVFTYAINKTSDVNNFLDWWKRKGQDKTIPMPDVQNALQIMTIHKAKGLEFDVVFIPFCNWKLGFGNNKNIIWTSSQETPFNQLDLLPVNCTKKLQQSIFADDYASEEMQTYIDNLNLLYVAFTRPIHELYCYCPQPIKDIPLLIWESLEESERKNYTSSTYLDDLILPEKIVDTPPTVSMPTSVRKEETATWRNLALKHYASNYRIKDGKMNSSRLNLGLIMHEILCGIKQKIDQDAAIYQMVSSGRINENEAKNVVAELQKFWNIKGVDEWFDGRYKVLNETAILTPIGTIYRPDRLMIGKDKKAIIVDYKFGDIESEKYIRQVQKYKELVCQMGYQVTGFLCYVEQNKLIEVN